MTDDPTSEKADRILEEALERVGARDPRDFYRDRLRTLKDTNPEGYQAAVEYYRDTLIPSVASGEADPLEAWTEYGRTLAEAVARGGRSPSTVRARPTLTRDRERTAWSCTSPTTAARKPCWWACLRI